MAGRRMRWQRLVPKREHVYALPRKPSPHPPPPCSEIPREVRVRRQEEVRIAKRVAKTRFLDFLDEKEDV